MSENNPLVSVVMPVYNAGIYLKDAIQDIIVQTYENWELICVDDGSTDGSHDVLEYFAGIDNRIRVITQENQGAGVARNTGMDAASGTYIWFIDADDKFSERFLEVMVKAIEEVDADIAICRSLGVDAQTGEQYILAGSLDTNLIPDKKTFSVGDIPDKVFQITGGWAWDKLYDLGFVRDSGTRFRNTKVLNDAFFTYKTILEAKSITWTDEFLVIHREKVENQVSSFGSKNWGSAFDLINDLRTELREKNLYDLLEQSFDNWTLSLLVYYFILRFRDEESLREFAEYYKRNRSQAFPCFHQKEFFYDEFAYGILSEFETREIMGFLASAMAELNQKNSEFIRLIKGLSEGMESTRMLMEMKQWTIPAEMFPVGTRLIVYGYGDMGHDFVSQILDSKRYELVMIVDNNKRGSNIHEIGDIANEVYDAILIAILDEQVANGATSLLLQNGVKKEKIFWIKYLDRG